MLKLSQDEYRSGNGIYLICIIVAVGYVPLLSTVR